MMKLERVRAILFWIFIVCVLAGSYARAQDGVINPIGSGAGTSISNGKLSYVGDPGSITNCTLTGTVSGNALTVALKTQAGTDPTAASPCVIGFRNVTGSVGDYTYVQVTVATSFVTGTSGSTFGSTNGNHPFRLWITAINNAGTVVIGVSNQTNTTTGTLPLNETGPVTSTACNACTNATAVGTVYSTAAQSGKAIRILGFMSWSAGLATAGTWNTGPDIIQLMGPGVPRPGQTVQIVYATNSTATAYVNATQTATSLTASITLTGTMNRVLVDAIGDIEPATQNISFNAQLSRGAAPTLIGNVAVAYQNLGAAATKYPASMFALDAPETGSAQAYTVFIVCSNTCTGNWNVDAVATVIRLIEIMS